MKNRRRRYFVRAGDQWGLLAGAVILILLLALVGSVVFYLVANRNLEHATYRAHFEILQNTMQLLLPWLILVNSIALIVVVIVAVFFTHKVAGPAFHLLRDFQRLREGDLTVRTRFRKGDRLKPLASAMRDHSENLQNVVSEVKRRLNELAEVAENHPGIKAKVAELQGITDRFKT